MVIRNEKRKNVVDYYLFYATNNVLGLKKMKEAMWGVGEAGEFRFSDATDQNQGVLFENYTNFDVLKRQIIQRLRKQDMTVGEIDEFVLTETVFLERHYKKVLKQLECDERVIEVINPPWKRRAGNYKNSSLILRFIPKFL